MKVIGLRWKWMFVEMDQVVSKHFVSTDHAFAYGSLGKQRK